MLSFKLLGGKHDQGDGKIYSRGDIVQSEKELDVQFGSRKFMRLDNLVEVATPPLPESQPAQEDLGFPELAGMTIPELRRFAEDEEIDLGRATRRDTILSIIRKVTA
jgi:hypothetical protein